MTIKVLIVDDSGFICKRIKQILEEARDHEGRPEFEVVGIANNGLQAIRLSLALSPDVITMDIEMPLMDGITAVKRIMAERPTPILMFSAMTQVGAQATLDALHAGAVDFLPKNLDEIDADRETAKRLLRRRVRMVALQTEKFKARKPKVDAEDAKERIAAPLDKPAVQTPKNIGRLRVIVIAASTGGPVAVQKVLSQLPQSCRLPVIIVQHMPQNFTYSFAERLNQLCRINVKEARDGDELEPGTALVAAGGMQLEIRGTSGRKSIALRPKTAGEIYSPCADITLASVAQHFQDHALAVVLTGMGSDGKEGARKLKQAGSTIWAQNEESCTIYGMPKAVIDAGLADHVYSLDEIGQQFSRII